MGLYEPPNPWSLLGFGMGRTQPTFHCEGIMFVYSDMLYVCVRYSIAFGPRCFKCLMLILSGPSELFVFACVIANFVSSVVIVRCDVCSFLVCLSIFCLFYLFYILCF